MIIHIGARKGRKRDRQTGRGEGAQNPSVSLCLSCHWSVYLHSGTLYQYRFTLFAWKGNHFVDVVAPHPKLTPSSSSPSLLFSLTFTHIIIHSPPLCFLLTSFPNQPNNFTSGPCSLPPNVSSPHCSSWSFCHS